MFGDRGGLSDRQRFEAAGARARVKAAQQFVNPGASPAASPVPSPSAGVVPPPGTVLGGVGQKSQTGPVSAEGAVSPTGGSFVRVFDQLHRLYRGPVTTLLNVSGYHKLNKASGEIEDTIDLKLAPLLRHWTALWLDFGDLGLAHKHGLHALEHCIEMLAPTLGVSDMLTSQHTRKTANLGCAAGQGAEHGGKLLFTPYSRTLAEVLPLLVERAANQIFDCGCEEGCPNCIEDPRCTYGRGTCDKQDAKELLRKLGYYREAASPTGAAGAAVPESGAPSASSSGGNRVVAVKKEVRQDG